MATLTTNNIKPVGDLDPLYTEQDQGQTRELLADPDAFLVWDASANKHKKVAWGELKKPLADQVSQAGDSAASALNCALESQAWANGMMGSDPAPSPQYQNNSLYYKNLAQASAGGAETNALKSEGYAVGTQGGAAAASGEPYYHDNAKFYKECAEGFAVGQENGVDVPSSSPYYENNAAFYADQADSSADSAGADALKAEGFAVGRQNGTLVQSGSPYYENNAEYYKDRAAFYASQAQSASWTVTISNGALLFTAPTNN